MQKLRARLVASMFLASAAATIAAGPATSQSLHGCENLDQSPTPAVEGLNGTFYRIDPDLLMDTRLSDAMIGSLSQISRTLEAQGTRLIYVPVPTKALVLPENLGPDAERYSYDVRLARALYADTIAQLRSEGISAVDAVRALSDASPGEPVFFGTDPRMTNEGLRQLARAAAAEIGEAHMGQSRFKTTAGDDAELQSHDRFVLQLSCQAELPSVSTHNSVTKIETPEVREALVAVVGSTITGGDNRNFTGFLSEALKRRVSREIVADDAHAALAQYLTSGQFHEDRPELIIWQVPIWQDPSRFGDQPLRELNAAARGECTPEMAAELHEEAGYRFSLEGASDDPGDSLRLDFKDVPVARAVFRFKSAKGQYRTRTVVRRDDATATPRVYLPLSGLWPEGASEVLIELNAASDTAPIISICRG